MSLLKIILNVKLLVMYNASMVWMRLTAAVHVRKHVEENAAKVVWRVMDLREAYAR